MELNLTLVLDVAAVLLMLYCLWSVISLKKSIPGGVIGSKWNILIGLVVLFSFGYLAMPFFSEIPPDILRLIISAVFFFGAIYVLITIKLLKTIINVLAR
jgi:hypothetical protein